MRYTVNSDNRYRGTSGKMNLKETASQKIKRFFFGFPEKSYHKDQVIISPDIPSDTVFYISSGRVKKYSQNYRDEPIIVEIYQAGSFIPIDKALGQKLKNKYFYAAETDVKVRVVPGPEMAEIVSRDPEIMMVILRKISRLLNDFHDKSLSLMTGNALSQVAYQIRVEAKKIALTESDNNSKIELGLNEKDIAARTGLSRETVNREIRKLKQIGAVEVDHSYIIVTDKAKLDKKVYKKLL